MTRRMEDGVHYCRYVRPDDRSECTNRAPFLVGIGTRTDEQQWSCSMHLAATIIAMGMAGKDMPPSMAVAVRWYPNGKKEGQ